MQGPSDINPGSLARKGTQRPSGFLPPGVGSGQRRSVQGEGLVFPLHKSMGPVCQRMTPAELQAKRPIRGRPDRSSPLLPAHTHPHTLLCTNIGGLEPRGPKEAQTPCVSALESDKSS